MMMAAVGAVGVLRWWGGCGRELAGEDYMTALLLLGQVFGDLRMVGADVADEAIEEPGRLQPAS